MDYLENINGLICIGKFSKKEVKELNQERVLMVQMMLKNGMSVSQIAKSISKSEEEIMKWIS